MAAAEARTDGGGFWFVFGLDASVPSCIELSPGTRPGESLVVGSVELESNALGHTVRETSRPSESDIAERSCEETGYGWTTSRSVMFYRDPIRTGLRDTAGVSIESDQGRIWLNTRDSIFWRCSPTVATEQSSRSAISLWVACRGTS